MTTATGEKTFDLRRELILSAEEDYVDLATVAHIVQEALRLLGDREVHGYTMGTLFEMLHDGYLRAGVPTREGGFEPWEGGRVEIMSRMASEWMALGRTPALGEIVWFEATERGISYLEDSTD